MWRNHALLLGWACKPASAGTLENWQVFKNLNMELAYISIILLLNIYPREMKTRSHKNLNTNVHNII